MEQSRHHNWRLLRWLGLAFGGLIIALALLASVAYSYSTGKGPFSRLFRGVQTGEGARIAASDSTISFGSIKTSQQKKITLSNKGNVALAIEQITATCECVSVNLSNVAIAPGAKKELLLLLDPSKTPLRGKQAFVLTILSNARNAPQLDLVVSANLR